MFDETATAKMWGHVLIRDPENGQVLLDKRNAIHYENMSVAVARALSGSSSGHIAAMCFGSGGSAVSGTGAITYFPPNVTGPNADLYNPTYTKRVGLYDTTGSRNTIEVKHIVNSVYADMIVTCTLDYNEPSGQDAFDDSTNLDGMYVFDELGLKAWDEQTKAPGPLLTHVVFNPIQKSLNRLIEVVYTVRIQLC